MWCILRRFQHEVKIKNTKRGKGSEEQLLDCVTPDSLRAEVATPIQNTHNDTHAISTKIKTHRERCQTLLHV